MLLEPHNPTHTDAQSLVYSPDVLVLDLSFRSAADACAR